MSRFTARRRLVTLAIGAIAATASIPAGAHAAGTADCVPETMSHPFAPWGDDADYVLAPDGGLEGGGASWTLAGGAAVVAGDESPEAAGAGEGAALDLPAGSAATTAPACIDPTRRSMRFLVKRTDEAPNAVLSVEIIVTRPGGGSFARPIGRVEGDAAWAPSPSLDVIAARLADAHDEALQVAFRFTPLGGSFAIDDVYVDPWRSR